jgi:hypothetical protein
MGACQGERERIATTVTGPRLRLGLLRQFHQAPHTAGQGSLALDTPGRDRLDNFSAACQDEIEAPPTVLVLTNKSGIENIDENTTDGKSFHSSGVRDGALGEIGSLSGS